MKSKEYIDELIQSGDYKNAIDFLSENIESQPDDLDSLKLLAALSGQYGLYGKTISCCNKILEFEPKDTDTLKNLAQAMICESNYIDAIPVFERIIKLCPDNAGVVNSLGSVYMTLMRFAEAAACFDRAIHLDPKFVDPLLNLGRVFTQFGHPGKAIDAYERLLGIQSDNFHARYEFAAVLMTAGRVDDSEIEYKKLLEAQPGHCDVTAGLSLLHKKQGNYQQSLELIKPIVDAGHVSPLVGVALANIAKKFGIVDQTILLLEEIVSASRGEENLSQVHIQLGKMYEGKKQYGKSFENYKFANDLQVVASEPLSAVNQAGESIKIWTPRFVAETPTSSNDTERPVFVVGLPRSGTSLVEQILSSHSEVHGAGELHALPDLISELPGMLNRVESYPLCLNKLTGKVVDAIARRYLHSINALAVGSSPSRITDKMPSNFLHLGLISLMFPNARIVHCMRNPIDTCLSIYFNQFPLAAYTTDLVNIGKHYLKYREIMAHWKSNLDLKIIDVSYEALIDSPEKNIRNLVMSCGLKWEGACLNFHSSKRFVNTLSHEQVSQPLYRSSIKRWKNYEEYIQPLIRVLSVLDD